MVGKWIPSQYRGVRYREDATRKHGVKADRYFAIRYQSGGKTKEEGVGWASEGVTAAKANETRAMFMQTSAPGCVRSRLPRCGTWRNGCAGKRNAWPSWKSAGAPPLPSSGNRTICLVHCQDSADGGYETGMARKCSSRQ